MLAEPARRRRALGRARWRRSSATGIDSLARAEPALRIEQAFGVRLGERSARGARRAISLGGSSPQAAPRLRPRSRPSRLRLCELKEQPQAGTLLEVLDSTPRAIPGGVLCRCSKATAKRTG